LKPKSEQMQALTGCTER